jgi:hypothetical protein
MAAPAMAVSQVERLKKARRLRMWNSLVASQPPGSAPAIPITKVRAGRGPGTARPGGGS